MLLAELLDETRPTLEERVGAEYRECVEEGMYELLDGDGDTVP